MLVGTVQRDSTAFYTKFVPDGIRFSRIQAKEIAALNPICTREELRPQTDLSYLFKQNPDVSGLSLVLDDAQRQEALESVQFEDFMAPKDHYDIFDLYEFVEEAKQSFKSLPVGFRMQYGNDPMNFLANFNNDLTSTKTIAALAEVLNRKAPESLLSQSSETTNVAPQTQKSDISVTPQTPEVKEDKK